MRKSLRVVKRRKLAATKPGRQKIVNVRSPLPFAPMPAGNQCRQSAVRDKSKLGNDHGGFTTYPVLLRAEYLRAVLRAPVYERCR
jgi:hypothetical protein